MPQNPDQNKRTSAESEEKKTPDVFSLHSAVMRELADPRDGSEPTPVWVILFCFFAIGWGGWYLALHTHNFSGSAYYDDDQPMQAGIATPEKVDPMVMGKRVFNSCSQCHQIDGKGVTGMYPPLAASEYVNGPPEVLARILLHGLEGQVAVKGGAYNGKMPQWSQLRDDQIAAVLTYVRASFGNNSAAVPPSLIESIRKDTLARKQPWSAADLMQAAPAPAPATKDAR